MEEKVEKSSSEETEFNALQLDFSYKDLKLQFWKTQVFYFLSLMNSCVVKQTDFTYLKNKLPIS